VRGVTFHGLDQIGNKIVAALELDINVGPGGICAHAQLYQGVVHRDQQEGD
jgi:hypothetical protein